MTRIILLWVLLISFSYSAAEKNIRIIIPTNLIVEDFDDYNKGQTAHAKLSKGDIIISSIASKGLLKKMQVEEEEVNSQYKYINVYVKHNKDDANIKLAMSYKNPHNERHVILANGKMSEESVGELKTSYSSSLDDLINLTEESYDNFYGIEVEDNTMLSALVIGNEEIFSKDRSNPSNLLARFIEDAGDINFGTKVPVLETEDDSFYIEDSDGGLWIAQDTYFDRTDAQLVKVPAKDTKTEKYDKPGSNYKKIDDYNAIKPENNPDLLDFVKSEREDGLFDYYFYSGEANEVFFKIDKDYKKDVYKGEYEPPILEGVDRITLKQYEAYLYRPKEGYVITLWITGEDNANHSNSAGEWNIGIVKESELNSNTNGGVDVVGGTTTKLTQTVKMHSSTTNDFIRSRESNVKIGEVEETLNIMNIK